MVVVVVVAVLVLTANLLFSHDNISYANLGHLSLYIDVVTFFFFSHWIVVITSANRSEDQYLRPIGVKNTSQPGETSPMSE